MDRPRLREYIDRYESAVLELESRIRASLGDVDKFTGPSLAAALHKAGALTEVVYTPTGKMSTKRSVLEETISDPTLRAEIIYRNVLSKSLSDFMRKWDFFSQADGRVHPNWNQVRSRSSEGSELDKGARTGRLSSDNPNFQNVPTEYLDLIIPSGLPDPPILRKLILPEEGHLWLKRDFSSQEVRILAHFEDGVLLQAYTENPSLDPHEMTRQLIEAATGLRFLRKHVKITGFQIVYGGGPSAVSLNVGCSYKEAEELIRGYMAAMPGVRGLQAMTKTRGYQGLAVCTWGGRLYYTEPPSFSKKFNRKMTFEYKLLNYLIQGSAADQTKECIIDWDALRWTDDIFMATVHDEICISAPEIHWQDSMDVLRHSMDMEREDFDCPMRSEGFVGPNWADLEEAT